MHSIEYLRSLLSYDAETGKLTWRVSPRWSLPVGSEAGTVKKRGHIEVSIDGKKYIAHRLIWALVTGEWPSKQIDHRDRQAAHNAWVNLREASAAQNSFNRSIQSNNSHGMKGVFFNRGKNRWVANIQANGRNRYLGCFTNAELAKKAYDAAAVQLHGEFACFG